MTLEQAAWLILGLNAIALAFTLAAFVAGGVRRRAATIIGVSGVLWLFVLRALLSNGEPFPEDIGGTAFFAIVLLSVALVGALLLAPASMRRPLADMDQTWLLAPQGIRVFFGATFLLWAGEGLLPRTFGVIDGFTHVTAGFLGLIAAWAVARDRNATRMPWIANLFGLGDILVVATSIAYVLLGDIGPHHPMMYAVFAPAPVWLWLHVVSIGRLLGIGTALDATRLTTASA
ncbi:MAG: hypothetical protein AAFZ07_23785 [Actinomycetota bacterium]